MKEKQKGKKKKRIISKILTIILGLSILILFGTIFYLNLIPFYYTIIVFLIFILIAFGLCKCNFSKKKGVRLIGYFFSIILISCCLFGGYYFYNTIGFFWTITNGNYALNTYNIVVLKESNYSTLKDLNKKTIGISETTKEDSLASAQEKINKKIKVTYENYEDIDSLISSLLENKTDAIILEKSELELLSENNPIYFESLKTIDKIEIKNSIKALQDAVNINNEPFNVYISGIDTYGNINSTSRSDVNILLTVNPKTEKVFITWVPRDYYVYINNDSYKDKLTHAGIYGIDSSIYAMEKLLKTNINYYVKVNFTSVIKVIDILDGVTVYNDQTFTTDEGQTFRKGNLTLNGKDALTFVRERHNVAGGDLGRGKNQIKVLEAIMKKAMSPNIITSYNKLLKSLDGAFVTNMNQSTMTGFIRKEIQKPRDWKIENMTLSGTDSSEYTYSYRNMKLYVMLPNEEIVKEAQTKIQNIIKKK